MFIRRMQKAAAANSAQAINFYWPPSLPTSSNTIDLLAPIFSLSKFRVIYIQNNDPCSIVPISLPQSFTKSFSVTIQYQTMRWGFVISVQYSDFELLMNFKFSYLIVILLTSITKSSLSLPCQNYAIDVNLSLNWYLAISPHGLAVEFKSSRTSRGSLFCFVLFHTSSRSYISSTASHLVSEFYGCLTPLSCYQSRERTNCLWFAQKFYSLQYMYGFFNVTLGINYKVQTPFLITVCQQSGSQSNSNCVRGAAS